VPCIGGYEPEASTQSSWAVFLNVAIIINMAKTNTYNPQSLEPKWQKIWEKKGIYFPKDILKSKKPFYNLWMFPYPSGEGLHAGHAFASSGSDIYGRFMRMHGEDIFQPIGYDSFGIHTENYALKVGEYPSTLLEKTTKHYEKQLKSLGHGYDWTRTVTTSDIDYYRWTQWLFIQLFKAGFAYRSKSQVNWCPSCKTVLADEQVIAGKCERCSSEVIQKELAQWFFRITDYAERLLTNLKKIDWSQRVKIAQKNWIGKSEGAKIKFPVIDTQFSVEVFTTRPDTLNAATFIVISPDSPLALKLTKDENRDKVSKYIKSSQVRPISQISKEKTGEFSGSYALNPLTNTKIPVWVADYVLGTYGFGVIMGVPKHDERDREFAKKFGIEVINEKPDQNLWQKIEKEGWGGRYTNFHLRDWLISRQRYWGPPIPMIYCQDCAKVGKSFFTENIPYLKKDQSDWNHNGWYPVDEKDLPIKLPEIENYQPTGTGVSPLAEVESFYKVKCPGCGREARRETDVSDTFLDSSWYFLRYPSVGSKTAKTKPFDPEITKKWLPVSFYFGGAEHSVLHLMYARFITMVLYDLKQIHFEEPFPRFFAHGLMIKEGAKMSKSRGNVVSPDAYIRKFGADAVRMYLVFIGPMDTSPDFRDSGIEGMRRFVDRIWRLYTEYKDVVLKEDSDAREILVKMHQTIKKVTEDIQNFRYNTAISAIMEFVNLLYDKRAANRNLQTANNKIGRAEWSQALRVLVQLLAPFAPHLTEEIWVDVLKEDFSVHLSHWPSYSDEFLFVDKIQIIVQVNGKLRALYYVGHDKMNDKEFVVGEVKKMDKVSKWFDESHLKDIIFVPGKLVNFVI